MTQAQEFPLVFDVQGSPVLGVLHQPASEARVCIVMVPAGGPQYHVGCCRQLLNWARRFAAEGVAVLRFDYRGMGDSGGDFAGFEQIDDDLKSALDEVQARLPGVSDILFWGGCNAASAIMMYAWKDPRVSGAIISNPWLLDEQNQARSLLKHHYGKRFLQAAFWKTLFRGEVDVFAALQGLLATLLKRFRPADKVEASEAPEACDNGVGCRPTVRRPYIERMLEGFKKFPGKVLILGSAGLVGKEFDEFIKSSRPWRRAAARENYERVILDKAGPTFADDKSLEEVFSVSLEWLRRHYTG